MTGIRGGAVAVGALLGTAPYRHMRGGDTRRPLPPGTRGLSVLAIIQCFICNVSLAAKILIIQCFIVYDIMQSVLGCKVSYYPVLHMQSVLRCKVSFYLVLNMQSDFSMQCFI